MLYHCGYAFRSSCKYYLAFPLPMYCLLRTWLTDNLHSTFTCTGLNCFFIYAKVLLRGFLYIVLQHMRHNAHLGYYFYVAYYHFSCQPETCSDEVVKNSEASLTASAFILMMRKAAKFSMAAPAGPPLRSRHEHISHGMWAAGLSQSSYQCAIADRLQDTTGFQDPRIMIVQVQHNFGSPNQ